MAKFMLLQNYGGVPDMVPMTEWSPEAIQAHIDFQIMLNRELTARGELVDAQGLSGPTWRSSSSRTGRTHRS